MKRILVTGATGYIGGRLVPRLLKKQYAVRCMVRDTSRIAGRWNDAEVVQGDVFDEASLANALKGIDAAYYLIHSMAAGESEFESKDVLAARTFSKAAADAGVKRIIYLGGLVPQGDKISKHLKSREQTGITLREGSVPVTEFQAGIIVGSGSLSFEMIRYLTERVIVMVTPKWVLNRTQPIAVRDILHYLIEALEVQGSAGKVIPVGGEDVLTYEELMKIYADVRGLTRHFIRTPVLSPRLSSHWVGLISPLPGKIARPLIEGVKSELIADTTLAHQLFDFKPLSYREAVSRALERQKENDVETVWSGALSSLSRSESKPVHLTQKEGMFIERREVDSIATAEELYKVVSAIGGKNGWYANSLWKLRGLMDRVIGGVGMRRGRRNAAVLQPGDPLDFWRVEAVEENKLLRLRAEMKLPGEAWLQFSISDNGDGTRRLNQTAFFEPRGLMGVLYWYSVYPWHKIIFGGMINDLKQKAEALSSN